MSVQKNYAQLHNAQNPKLHKLSTVRRSFFVQIEHLNLSPGVETRNGKILFYGYIEINKLVNSGKQPQGGAVGIKIRFFA